MEDNIEHDLNINRYLSAILLSAITYTVIALGTNIQLVEIMDLELPLIIVLSIILTYFSLNDYKRIIYPVYIALIIITLIKIPHYSFFIMIVLFGELTIELLNRIFNNKYDYAIN